jgi:hypothetical protein
MAERETPARRSDAGPPGDTLVECGTCGGVERVEFAKCLNAGWPTCCGETMRLLSTEVSVEQATRSALGGQGVPGLMLFDQSGRRVDARADQ